MLHFQRLSSARSFSVAAAAPEFVSINVSPPFEYGPIEPDHYPVHNITVKI